MITERMILPAEVSFFGYFKISNRSKQKTFDFSPVLPNGFTVVKILVIDLEVVVGTCFVVVGAFLDVVVGTTKGEVDLGILVATAVLLVVGAVGCVISDD